MPLDSAKCYTEDLFKKIAKENHFTSNAANVRNYLGEILTDALVDFKRKNSPRHQFQKALLLHERKFHEEALQIIKKIKSEFDISQKKSFLLAVINLETELVLKNQYTIENAEKSLLLSKEFSDTANYMHLYAEVAYIGKKAFYLLKKQQQSELKTEELLLFEKEFNDSYVSQHNLTQIPPQLALITIGSLRQGYTILGYNDKLEKFLTECVTFFSNPNNRKQGSELSIIATLAELSYLAFDLKNEACYLLFLDVMRNLSLSNKFNETAVMLHITPYYCWGISSLKKMCLMQNYKQ